MAGSRGHRSPLAGDPGAAPPGRTPLPVAGAGRGDAPPACAFALICEVEQKDISANLLFFVHLDAIKDGVGVREIGHVKVADLAEQGCNLALIHLAFECLFFGVVAIGCFDRLIFEEVFAGKSLRFIREAV